MNRQEFAAAATGAISSFDDAAHRAIGMYREGGERLAHTMESRWKAALKESAPKLKPGTRKNATRAQQAFGGYYTKGLALTAAGAEAVVDTVVGAAFAAVERTKISRA
jgi:hypothetical protein